MFNKISFFVCLLLSQGLFAYENPFKGIASAYLLEVDGEVKWAYNLEKKLQPASLTKIMTAVIVLENTSSDEIIDVHRPFNNVKGAMIGIERGEKYLRDDLLYAMLLQSANDVCLLLGEHVAGNVSNFVNIMNKKALKLGMKNTKFKNPCGYDEMGHFSSAKDLSLLSRYALKNKVFKQIIATKNKTISPVNKKDKNIALTNSNQLLFSYEGVYGVKTGSTLKAGECLIVAVEKEGRSALLILLNAANRFHKARQILDLAFN